MTLTVDRNIFSDSCISKVVYWLSGQYAVSRTLAGDTETLTIEGDISDEDAFRAQVLRHLHDYKLREIVEIETHDIRTILYAKAFADCEDLEV